MNQTSHPLSRLLFRSGFSDRHPNPEKHGVRTVKCHSHGFIQKRDDISVASDFCFSSEMLGDGYGKQELECALGFPNSQAGNARPQPDSCRPRCPARRDGIIQKQAPACAVLFAQNGKPHYAFSSEQALVYKSNFLFRTAGREKKQMTRIKTAVETKMYENCQSTSKLHIKNPRGQQIRSQLRDR